MYQYQKDLGWRFARSGAGLSLPITSIACWVMFTSGFISAGVWVKVLALAIIYLIVASILAVIGARLAGYTGWHYALRGVLIGLCYLLGFIVAWIFTAASGVATWIFIIGINFPMFFWALWEYSEIPRARD